MSLLYDLRAFYDVHSLMDDLSINKWIAETKGKDIEMNHNKVTGKKVLYGTVALSLAIVSFNNTPTLLVPTANASSYTQIAQATNYAFEQATLSDSRFLEIMETEITNAPSHANEISLRALELRPQLESQIVDVTASVVGEVPSGLSAATGVTTAATTAGAAGVSSTTAVVAGGAALAAAGGVAAAAGGGGSGGGSSDGGDDSDNGDDSDQGDDDDDQNDPEPPPPEEPDEPDEPDEPNEPEEPDEPNEPDDPPPPPSHPPEHYEDAEYNQMGALGSIKASSAYSRGYTGEGVTVAIVDSGMDIHHHEFQDRVVNPYNAVHDNDTVTDRDPYGHGTHVGGLIGASRDGNGMHGVAFNADLMPISLSDNNGDFTIGSGAMNLGRAWEHAAENGASVINNSFTFVEFDIRDYSPEDIRVGLPGLISGADAIVENDIVSVFATGNEGFANPESPADLPVLFPEYQDNWVAVGAVDENGDLMSFSNACGDAAEWCLVAPGHLVESTVPGGNYDYMRGTSMAAPIVSGGVALMREAWPHLTAGEITEILFTTADDLGNTDHYGHGMLNLDKATQPIGATSIPQGSTVNGKTVSLDSTSMNVSAAFGDGIATALSGHSLIGFDDYGRDFAFDMSNFVDNSSIQNTGRDALHRLKLFGGIEEDSINTINQGPFSITTAARLQSNDPSLGNSGYSSMTFGFTGQGYSIEASLNPDMGRNFGFRSEGFGTAPMMEATAFDQPHLGLMETGYASTAGFNLGKNSQFRVGAFTGNTAPDKLSVFSNTPSVMGAVGEFSTAINGNATLKASLGAISEEGSLLGTVSRGAFGGESMKSDTTFGTLGGAFGLGNDISLTLTGSVGHTNFKQNDGIVSGGSNLITSSFGAGLAKHNLFDDGDRASFAIAQPLRIEGGKVDLSVPTSRDVAGNIGYTRMSLSPQPTGREVNLQASYGFDIMAGVKTNVGVMHRINANHVKGNHESIGMVSTSLNF